MGDDAAEATGWTRHRMGRRAFLISGVGAGLTLPLLGATSAWAQPAGVPPGGQLAFKVMRKGVHIGEHALTFTQDGDNLSVHTEVRITIKVGPVPVYHYVHRCTERWTGARFTNLESSTSANGVSRESIKARRTSDGIYIEPAVGDPYTASADCLPLTHWNRLAYQGAPLFNPQDGKLLHETAKSLGADTINLADGRPLAATRYSLTGESKIDDWYDEQGVWAALRGTVKDGSVLDYRRVDT